MGDLDFLKSFYSSTHNRETLLRGLDSLNSVYQSCRAIPFSCDIPPKEYFVRVHVANKFIKLIYDFEGVQLFNMKISLNEKGEKKEHEGLFFILEHLDYEKVYVAITLEDSVFFQRGIISFIQSLYPIASFTFITHTLLKKLIENFKAINKFKKIKITRASLRIRFEEEGTKEKIMPMVGWPNMDIEDAFKWVYENNGWFQSLQLEVLDDLSTYAYISITRQGYLQTKRFFLKSFNSFINPICQIIQQNISLFSNRSRRENPNLNVKPLAIDFGSDQFIEVEENKKFIQIMKSLKASSVSVLHGNPYIHLSIIDYFDGSGFDLWVTDPRKVIIVPQMKGSMPAIKRIINHIFDTYAEGNIVDYQQ